MLTFRFHRDARWLIDGHKRRWAITNRIARNNIVREKDNMRPLYQPFIDIGVFTHDLEFTDLGIKLCEMVNQGIGVSFSQVPLNESSLLWGVTAINSVFDF